MGAPWPASSSATEPTAMAGRPNEFHTTQQQRNWWAHQPVVDVQPPLLNNSMWPSNGIDQFILAKLEARSSSPSPPADRRVWLRRVTYDLTGFPPMPGELDAFLLDQ